MVQYWKASVPQRPRVQASHSISEAPNQRWITNIALVYCGTDGWRAMVPVIDCCTREILCRELHHTAREEYQYLQRWQPFYRPSLAICKGG